ncbi:glycosyltransferase [Aeromicrobium endophyticum]|uniref:Glycosyltransferase n=1 Tax=Aeromicrobium endophyticum TaxID=2292704 RepID=A0A371PC81_9ACTN|nr:glycosyltransferase [Aeromicrobium endophyticum]REK73010.1 glycosyltransferase [Aeromicrobium endophyticum]
MGSARGRSERELTLVALGAADPERDGVWLRSGFVKAVVRGGWATPSGYRFGSRALGLGLDSLVIAVKARLLGRGGPYLAANPWIAVALVATGARRVAVTGVYAEVGSRSHRLLRAIIRDRPVVTLAVLEAAEWSEAGGQAIAVRYGNTLGYPKHAGQPSDAVRVFVGGSSDRDPAAMHALEEEVRREETPVHLVIADGGEPAQWAGTISSVTRTGWLSADDFGRQVAAADVVFLPLKAGHRAAGHMVMVGALEAGVAVVATDSRGMDGYVDGEFVSTIDADRALLPQIVDRAVTDPARAERIRDYWRRTFSLEAYVERVGTALSEMTGQRLRRAGRAGLLRRRR